jgi:hypothetical protein
VNMTCSPMRYSAVNFASALSWRFSAESSYCWPGQSVKGCVTVSVQLTTADLNCAIVPLDVGSFSEPTVMAESRSSTDHGGTVPSSLTAKFGFDTMFEGSAQAASICSCVAGVPARRKRISRSVGAKEVGVGGRRRGLRAGQRSRFG